jgi:hypothetical protein
VISGAGRAISEPWIDVIDLSTTSRIRSTLRNGYLLSYFAARGVQVTGIEGSNRAHDLVVSTEVAEHLPKQASQTFVANVTNSARQFIAFSAAHPGQCGDGHFNCQPAAFWLRLFNNRGWIADGGATGLLLTELEADAGFRERLPLLLSNVILLRPVQSS